MALVYSHKRLDNNQIFYVGIELDSDKKQIGKRPYKKQGKSKIWNNIVNKTDYIVEILLNNISNQEAVEVEKYLIKYYGRINLKTGTLANLTDGGEGITGFKHSKKTLLKMKKSATGRTWSNDFKLKLSLIHKGKRSKNLEKKVIDTSTGIIYDSVTILAREKNILKSTLTNKLNGHRSNNTTYKYYLQ